MLQGKFLKAAATHISRALPHQTQDSGCKSRKGWARHSPSLRVRRSRVCLQQKAFTSLMHWWMLFPIWQTNNNRPWKALKFTDFPFKSNTLNLQRLNCSFEWGSDNFVSHKVASSWMNLWTKTCCKFFKKLQVFRCWAWKQILHALKFTFFQRANLVCMLFFIAVITIYNINYRLLFMKNMW